MSLLKHKISVIAILWTIIVIIQIIFPNSIGKPQYNGYYVGVFAIICYVWNPNIKIGLISLFSVIILLFFSDDILHPIIDFTIIILTLTGFNIAFSSKINNSERKFIGWSMAVFVALDVLGLIVPELYSDGNLETRRYEGVLHSSNVSASVFSLCQIAFYELKKDSKRKRLVLFSSFGLFVIMLLMTKTRSMLFFMPYWIIQFYNKINRKLFWCLLASIVIYTIQSILSIQQDLRLEEEGSFITRKYLYETLIDGIINQPFIPHGSSAANLLSRKLIHDENFAAHNDFLLYIYDWGLIFFVLFIFIWKYWKQKIKSNWTNLSILLGWSSTCLHNVLLLPPVLFVFLMILNIEYNSQDRKHIKKTRHINCFSLKR